MTRILVLTLLGATVAVTSMASHIQDYPRGLESLFGTKREAVSEKEKERSVCQSEECKLIAKVMKDGMNESIDPCDDFYEYACGQWANNNPAPENTSSWSLWNMVEKKIEKQVKAIIQDDVEPDDLYAVKLAKMWYQSCMDTEAEERRGVEPLLSTLWRHGGWPLIMEEGEWDSRIYNWQIVDDHFARLLGFNAFHDISYGSVSYDTNDTILIETPHLPIRLSRLLKHPPPPTSDSSDENNESGEGSQEKGSKERGNNQGDKEEEDNENEDSGVDEDSSPEDDSENNEENENGDEEELRRKKITGRRGHKRVGHSAKRRNKDRIAGHSISERKLRKRTKRDVMRTEVLHRMLRKKLDKTRNHHTAKKTKGKPLKHGHGSVKKSHATNGERHKIAHSKKIEHKNHARGHHEARKGQRKNKLTKRKNHKRLGHGRRKNNKNKVTHVHGRDSKIHNKKHHVLNKVSNHKTHLAAKKINQSRRRHIHPSSDTENIDSDTETDNESEEEDSNVDENNNKEGDEEENSDNGDNSDNSDDSGNTNEDEDEDNDDEDDEDNEEEDDEEEDDSKKSDAEDDEEKDDSEDSDTEGDEEDDSEENDAEDDEEENIEELKEMYRQYILNVSLVLAKGRGLEVPKEKLEKGIADLVEFAVKVGQLLVEADDEPVDTTLDHFQKAFNQLDSDINTSPNSKINWKRKILNLFEEAGVELEDDVEITVTCQTYIRGLKKLLDETPSETIVNYIHWLFIDKMAMLSISELRPLSENWIGTSHYDSREEQCIQQVEMNEIVGYQYVKKHFPDEIEATARDMIDDIQKEVEHQIEDSKWMDDDTKHFILDKLVTMKNMVGHPDWYENTTAVKNYFQGLTIGPSYYENIMNYVRHLRWKMLRRILQDESQETEFIDPLMLNAFFIPTENSITVTAADFQNPMFALNRPWNINYGIIGVIMGHEVNHGFDNEGRFYDRQGNLMEWLSAMAAAYNKRAECFIDQFNQYSLFKGENYTVENYGNQTIGENIADTMGLQAVYRAYQRRQRECKKPDPALPGLEEFSNDQIFFLSFANLWCDNDDRESIIMSAKYDVHSTGRLRVIGSVSNSEDFAKAFKCPVGSPMNPKRKCNIWT